MAAEESSNKETAGAPPASDKKYFVEARSILTRKKAGPRRRLRGCAVIIDSSKVMMSDKRVRLPLLSQPPGEGDDIQVDVIREGENIKSIKIRCRCGRSTELNCEYAHENAK